MLEVRADDLVPVVAAAGPDSRLIGMGAADSGIAASVELEQDSEGYFAGFRADLSEWWTNAVSLAGPTGGHLSMTVEFRLEPFDTPLNPDPPCPSPITTTEDNGLTVLVCSR